MPDLRHTAEKNHVFEAARTAMKAFTTIKNFLADKQILADIPAFFQMPNLLAGETPNARWSYGFGDLSSHAAVRLFGKLRMQPISNSLTPLTQWRF